ncbi:MAG: hypothetical protein KJ634_07295 [Gammaproteobacteria bacterium]|nr:hypothetical protein [Gammaproteobacteria bacterium]MBU1415412.1 hypothetical protein [Gammaproteobacteria bacterium]
MAATGREFIFTQADFERVRALIRERAGIALAPAKQDMVYSRLVRRVRALGLTKFEDYLRRLDQDDKLEWETFINSLTTNLTSFFREAHHFETFARQATDSKQRPFRVWCAAASTGEEPYSLAIAACEAFDSYTPPVQILASDIDTHVLATAARGIYDPERVERIAESRVRRFFTIEKSGDVRVRSELQRLISFSRINLLDRDWPIQGPLDAIFCRNVMIYFDKPIQHQILARFRPLLRPDGLLYAGHSESFLHAADLFHPIGRTVYERSDHSRAAAEVGSPVTLDSRDTEAGKVPAPGTVGARLSGRLTSGHVVAIGASTGGTEAIKAVLRGLPAEMPPIVMVQHMPESFTKSFAQRLDSLSMLTVVEAQGGEVLRPGHVYLAPGHSHMSIKRIGGGYRIDLSRTDPVNRHRPAVDVLFNSVAASAVDNATGIILTGMGKDGAQGLLAMRRAGAWTIGQDEASCVVYGMPREAVSVGGVSEVVSLSEIAGNLLAHLQRLDRELSGPARANVP